MHRTLLRQIQRALGDTPTFSPEWQKLLEMVSVTYEDFDKDRVTIERSLEISSKELRLAVATMKTTLDAVGEAILVVDENKRITYFNKRFAELWEIPTEQIIARQTEQVFSSMVEKSVDQKLFRQIIDQADSGQEIGGDVTIKLHNDAVLATKTYPQLLEGRVVGQIWSFRNITKYISFQEQIQEKVTMLERLNKTMVDRELKMIELKEKIAELENKLVK